MKHFYLMLAMLFLGIQAQAQAEDDKVKIPDEQNWGITENRDLSVPELYQDYSHVYIYSEKQLDNLTIGITDIQGNVYHQEVTTVPACTFYAVSIETIPEGVYYLCIYQGSNYVMGLFNK